jgi:hypothetical protein
MGPHAARTREHRSPILIHLVRSPLLLNIGRVIVLTTGSSFGFETRHKKSLLSKKAAGCVFKKLRCFRIGNQQLFLTNSSASSAARLSFPGIHGVGERDALAEAGPW